MTISSTPVSESSSTRHVIKGAVVRFAGDSGDGMQVTGDQFTSAAALAQTMSAKARNRVAAVSDGTSVDCIERCRHPVGQSGAECGNTRWGRGFGG